MASMTSCTSTTTTVSSHLEFEETELRLGLPGSDEVASTKKRTSSAMMESSSDSNEVASTKKRTSSAMMESSSDSNYGDQDCAPPPKAQVVGWPPVRSYRKNCFHPKSDSTVYVKVSMDGAPYLRKIDLKVYRNYQELLKALENMFKCTIGYNGSSAALAPTYEDKDGDWMLVGDVPWEMFITSCKRLRIMRGSDAEGLKCL